MANQLKMTVVNAILTLRERVKIVPILFDLAYSTGTIKQDIHFMAVEDTKIFN